MGCLLEVGVQVIDDFILSLLYFVDTYVHEGVVCVWTAVIT